MPGNNDGEHEKGQIARFNLEKLNLILDNKKISVEDEDGEIYTLRFDIVEECNDTLNTLIMVTGCE